jgi:hypothetical protein
MCGDKAKANMKFCSFAYVCTLLFNLGDTASAFSFNPRRARLPKIDVNLFRAMSKGTCTLSKRTAEVCILPSHPNEVVACFAGDSMQSHGKKNAWSAHLYQDIDVKSDTQAATTSNTTTKAIGRDFKFYFSSPSSLWRRLPMVTSLDKLTTALPHLGKPSLLVLGVLSVIIPHGLTDLFEGTAIRVVLGRYAAACAVTAALSRETRYFLLFVSSWFHMRHDIQSFVKTFGLGAIKANYIGTALPYIYSTIIHMSWVLFPSTSMYYLGFVHTPLHYTEVLPRIIQSSMRELAIPAAGLATVICFASLKWRGCKILRGKFVSSGIWIGPVIAHISLVG